MDRLLLGQRRNKRGFFQLFFEVGSEDSFTQIFFYFFDLPKSSIVQFVAGVDFFLINGFVDKNKLFFTAGFKNITGEKLGGEVCDA